MKNKNLGAAAPRSLTLTQKRRLAEEARRLAMDVLEGRATIGPVYTEYAGCPACAIGQLARRSGLGLDRMTDDPIVDWYDSIVFSASIVMPRIPSEYFAFPLLAMAEELDASEREPPKAPQ